MKREKGTIQPNQTPGSKEPVDLEAAFLLEQVKFLLSETKKPNARLSSTKILTIYDDIIKLIGIGYKVDGTEINKLLLEYNISAPPLQNPDTTSPAVGAVKKVT